MNKMKRENDALVNKISSLQKPIEKPIVTRLTFDKIRGCDEQVKTYTGLPSSAMFEWFYDGLSSKMDRLHYFKGSGSFEYQNNYSGPRPGPSRTLDQKTEILLTLMKLKLGLVEADLAYRFEISKSQVSAILSTMIAFLGAELRMFIRWPEIDAVKTNVPRCFSDLGIVLCIIDCTEVSAQKPSLAKANSQMYSTYKSQTTVKILVGCTCKGAISYLSKVCGGAMSDREIVVRSDFLQYVKHSRESTDERLTVLADRGFNIQDLLLPLNVSVMIPPFLRGKRQFNEVENKCTKRVASARIHVERVIGRMKTFHVLQNTIPSEMFDLIDDIIVICSAIVNLNGSIVPM